MLFLPNRRISLCRTFALHGIRWCFETVGAGTAKAVPSCSPIGWHQRHNGDESDMGEPRRRLKSERTDKMKKAWGPLMLVSFLWLGPQMLRQNPTISNAVFDARTSLYWLMVTTKLCDLSRAANIFHATSVWGWRSQAGKCWIMRGMPWVLQKWSDSGKKYLVILWSWETGCTLFPRTSLSTRLVQWTRTFGFWLSFILHWSTASGRKLWTGVSALGAVYSVSVQANVDVTWSRDEVYVSISTSSIFFYVTCEHSVCRLFRCTILNGMYPWILSRCINCAKPHGSCGVQFEEQGEEVRVFARTWVRDIFRLVCVATLDRYTSDPHQEVSALGWLVDPLGPDVSVVSISGGATTLMESFCEYLGSGYRQKLIDYPSFDLGLFKRCLQRTASSVFSNLDGLAMTEFIVNRLKGAETRDWMSTRAALRKAILTNNLCMPHLVDIVANITKVWPLIFSSLKKTGSKDYGDSLVVKSSSFNSVNAFSYPFFLYLWCLEEGNGRVFLPGSKGAYEVSSAAPSSWNLQVVR